MGGTFDPVHVGHLVVATTVHQALHLDETRVIVAGVPWQKVPPVAPATERFEAVDAALRDMGVEGVVADDREIRRGGPTYTIDTVEELLDERPGAQLFLPLGADAVALIETWHRAADLRHLVTVVVVNRPGFDEVSEMAGWKVEKVRIPSLEVSSSMLRERMAAGFPADALVPAAAMRVVRKYGRYAGA